MKLTLDVPLTELHKYYVAGLSSAMSRKLALAVSGYAAKSDVTTVTVEDLLNYFPMRWEDRSNLVQADELITGMESSVELVVRVSGGFKVGKNRSPRAPQLYIFEVTAGDVNRRHKPVVVFWFLSGRAAAHAIGYYQERFKRGTRFVAYGKWEWDTRRNTFALKLAKPDELEILPPVGEEAKSAPEEEAPKAKGKKDAEDIALEEDTETPEFAMIHAGRRVPVYRKLGPFQTKRLREIIFSTIEKLDRSSVKETLPQELLERRKLVGRFEALAGMHFPPEASSIADYGRCRSDAHRRMIFEEFFWVTFALQLKRGERTKEPKGAIVEITKATKERIKKLLPFQLTGAQSRVVEEIFEDLQSDAPMNRLVQGDVGSGKTIVALLSMYVAMESGYQVALMAPTEILAEQHLRNARNFLEGTPYRAELLVGSMKASEKKKVQEAVREGEVHAVIGTHAVIQDKVEFDKLGLAVIDEQHRFGVLQRAQLREMGFNPDVLVMTATPIPRSLAMTVYGDLEVSIIDELPPGRTPVKTVVVGEDQREGVYKGINREVSQGRQVYIVYPLIEESEKTDLKAATKMYEELRDKVFPKLSVGLLHGKMKAAEKEEIMGAFKKGELDILVSTTVIEVGVDVPNASLMIIEHAERFGLSQLHQLRGRVGRGADQSFCVLLTGDRKTIVAKERLGIMEATSDGFKIAEKDLEIRGQGDILGTRQSGIQLFKIGNIMRDLDVLEDAREEAELYLGKKRDSRETAELIGVTKRDARLKLAGIG